VNIRETPTSVARTSGSRLRSTARSGHAAGSAASREPRAASREPRAASREPRAASRDQAWPSSRRVREAEVTRSWPRGRQPAVASMPVNVGDANSQRGAEAPGQRFGGHPVAVPVRAIAGGPRCGHDPCVPPSSCESVTFAAGFPIVQSASRGFSNGQLVKGNTVLRRPDWLRSIRQVMRICRDARGRASDGASDGCNRCRAIADADV
jgi:hypothetical protein